MEHFSLEEWRKYAKNELSEPERELYENHLYICDQCLEVYLEAMDEEEDSLPAMPGKRTLQLLSWLRLQAKFPKKLLRNRVGCQLKALCLSAGFLLPLPALCSLGD